MRFPEALREQAISCVSLGSPFMGRLLTFLADHMPRDSALWDRIENWPAPLGPSHASLPLRLAGGLHNLVLNRADPDLASVYPPHDADDARFGQAVLGALKRNEAFLLGWITRPPQTNEVRRSVGLIPAAHVIASRFPLPFVTSELGASGGINQMFDRYALQAGDMTLGAPDSVLTLTPDWTGPTPVPTPFAIAERGGVDLTPLKLKDPAEVTRLLSYLWPDQPDRRAQTLKAVAALDTTIDQGDAVDWLETRLATPRPGRVHVIYHTVAWQYFPPQVQARGESAISEAGAQATEDAPLARISMEADEKGRGAALTLQTWPGDGPIVLARIDFHGRWMHWTDRAGEIA